MPKREDLYPEDEYVDPERQLHRHVLYHAQRGDVVVVDARADLTSGVFGAMMMTYFRGRGGLGVVIDGAIRDFAEIKAFGLGIWLRGVTPNFHTQTNIFPFAVNVPIACGGVTVLPGDIIIADDDGAVVVPIQYAPRLAQKAVEHVEWKSSAVSSYPKVATCAAITRSLTLRARSMRPERRSARAGAHQGRLGGQLRRAL